MIVLLTTHRWEIRVIIACHDRRGCDPFGEVLCSQEPSDIEKPRRATGGRHYRGWEGVNETNQETSSSEQGQRHITFVE